MKTKIFQLVLVSFIFIACLNQEIVLPTQTAILPTPKTYPTALPETWIGDAGLVSGKPCFAPCFFGIFAGQTSINQAFDFLEANGDLFCVFDNETDIVCDNIIVTANPSTSLVESLGFSLDKMISVESIISVYGEPNYIKIQRTSIPEAPKSFSILMFDEVKMVIWLPEISGEQYPILHSTSPELIMYFDDTNYVITKDLYAPSPWNGYGIYEP
ncbi:MAG: hypothetical protein UZ14_CFX002000390 [Chloroflexi bacterium OLB14]|nr:MAG: hypothetical protein UZ14_CFX002000390 [Chloroflexi bacterium OLB14]